MTKIKSYQIIIIFSKINLKLCLYKNNLLMKIRIQALVLLTIIMDLYLKIII